MVAAIQWASVTSTIKSLDYSNVQEKIGKKYTSHVMIFLFSLNQKSPNNLQKLNLMMMRKSHTWTLFTLG